MAADARDDTPMDVSTEPEDIPHQMEAARASATPSGSDEKPSASQAQPAPSEKPPSKLKQLWQKTGLDLITLKTMFKGSLPPTIGIAMYQAKSVQDYYGTIGYLVAISSILAFCIMPRGKFLQNIIINTFTICVAAAVNLLALYCSQKARAHTTPPGPQASTYNASASAVLALWLIFQTWAINTVRASRPQLQFPTILFSIFTDVALTYGVAFPDTAACISFMKTLLETFLTGFALAAAVHFLVFPMSSRTVVMKEWTGYIGLLGGMLKTQVGYMESLSTVDPVKLREEHEKADRDAANSRHHKKDPTPHTILETPAQLKYNELRQKLIELHSKIEGDITPAKREIAIGKLESHDLTEIWKLMRMIFIPVMGLSSMTYILEQQAKARRWAEPEGNEEELNNRQKEIDNLHFLLKELHAPFSAQVANIDEALHHLLLTLELVKPPKKKKKQPDEESNADQAATPGTPAFAEAYKKKVDGFYASKQRTLRDWCHEHGIELPADFFDTSSLMSDVVLAKDEHMRQTYQRQLFFTLYLEYLLWRVSTAVLDLILFVDKRKQDGTFNRSRLIFPGSKAIYKWMKAAFGREDITQDDSYTAQLDPDSAQALYTGEEFGPKRDPEHLPPRNRAEKIGNAIRAIPRFLRSEESVFGLRVAAATMTIGITCYLSATQTFFLQQRFLWALIMIAISMTRSSGQSVMNFALRVIGTTIAMVGSYIIWYIVDGKTPGVIVFLWLWMFLAFYVVLKFPKVAVAAILGLVTALLIIGYELQVQAIGVYLSTANGQPAYPVYILAPYRLAIVICGLLIAFIWTIFPFPVSESSIIRKDITAALYLLCSFYSIVHEGISIRVTNTGGDQDRKGTYAYNLDKVRAKVFSKLLRVLSSLRMNSGFSKFQLQIGGRFPRETYEELINSIQRLMFFNALASYTSSTFQHHNEGKGEMTKWSSDFRELMSSLDISSNQTTSMLSLLSSSLSNAQPLPPYLELPQPFHFVKMIEAIDRDILSIRHIAEPEYSAFAVLQIVSTSMNQEIVVLISLVKELVGEIDFSFHSLKSKSSDSASSSATASADKGKSE